MKRLLLACVPTAVRRSRACVLLFTLTAGFSAVSVFAQPYTTPLFPPKADSDYLFMPGHGLTARTVRDVENGNQLPTIQQAIDEAKNINNDVGGSYRPKITFIEHAYTWADFQPNNDTFEDIRIDGLDGLGGLKADLIKCRSAGLRLRVLLSTHKYAESFPAWIYELNPDDDPEITAKNNIHTVMVDTGAMDLVPMVRLNNNNTPNYNDSTFMLLKRLYARITTLLQDLDPELQDTFYGFVLQEPSHGHGAAPLIPEETAKWFTNLYKLHEVLGFKLGGGFDMGASGKPKRLFWQMINYPDDAAITAAILTSMETNHGGLCGPDTFPGEPHLNWKNSSTNYKFENGLANAYDAMRVAWNKIPLSLHVYRLNYLRPYQGGLNRPAGVPGVPAVKRDDEVPEEQPIYLPDNDPTYTDDTSINDYGVFDTDNSPRGIANFLGCVANPHAESLKVNNVVWSIAQGPTVDDPDKLGDQRWDGWRDVKVWMKSADSVAGNSGGCRAYTPNSIYKAP